MKSFIHCFCVSALLLTTPGLFFSGCATDGRHHGKLSDAIEAASDENDGDREVDNTHTHPIDDNNYEQERIRVQETSPHGVAGTAREDSTTRAKSLPLIIGARVDQGLAGGEEFSGFNRFTIGVGARMSPRMVGFFHVGLGFLEMEKNSELRLSIDPDPVYLHVGAQVQYFFTPEHTLMGLYAHGGIDIGYMNWGYKNDIQVDGDVISGDGLKGMDIRHLSN